jgi:hypothetical protein
VTPAVEVASHVELISCHMIRVLIESRPDKASCDRAVVPVMHR